MFVKLIDEYSNEMIINLDDISFIERDHMGLLCFVNKRNKTIRTRDNYLRVISDNIFDIVDSIRNLKQISDEV